MIPLPSKHRSFVLLAVIVAAQVLLLAAQIRRQSEVRLIRVWAVTMISPFQRAGAWTAERVRGGWRNYIGLRGARQENDSMRAELDRLKLRNAQLESKAAEADRLAGLLGFQQAHADVPMVAARVIAASPDAASRIIQIDRGEADGIRKNMGVITPEGVVGKVIESYRHTAQVLLLTDKDSGVGALLESSRVHGPVSGTGDPLLAMKYVSNDETVNVGDRVLTSGQDRIFPKDLPVGTVVEAKQSAPFKSIQVKPAAHLERLEEVLVLLTRQELEPKKDTERAEAPAKSPRPAVKDPAKQPDTPR